MLIKVPGSKRVSNVGILSSDKDESERDTSRGQTRESVTHVLIVETYYTNLGLP